jgi:hypothetical protein
MKDSRPGAARVAHTPVARGAGAPETVSGCHDETIWPSTSGRVVQALLGFSCFSGASVTVAMFAAR